MTFGGGVGVAGGRLALVKCAGSYRPRSLSGELYFYLASFDVEGQSNK